MRLRRWKCVPLWTNGRAEHPSRPFSSLSCLVPLPATSVWGIEQRVTLWRLIHSRKMPEESPGALDSQIALRCALLSWETPHGQKHSNTFLVGDSFDDWQDPCRY